ncbi:MAG: hypothetical protein DDT41_01675 [candidate division WS2 bacterium]|nr:hypothetical protein [Candidatus Psychracetigena formicireducens]
MNIHDACTVGNLDWIKEHYTAEELLNRSTPGGFLPHELAASLGHLHILKWLVKESGLLIDLTSYDNRAVRLAIEEGHLPVVQWLIRESGQPVDVNALEGKAIREAMLNRRFHVIKWLVEESGQSIDIIDLYNFTIRSHSLTIQRPFEIIEWLKERATIGGHKL